MVRSPLPRPPLLPARVLAAALLLAGCASPAPPPAAAAAPATPTARHGYALLFSILDQERNASKLLAIHENRAALGALIEDISKTTGAAYERLEALGKADPKLDLADTGLPSAELATRAAVKDVRTKILLPASDKELELQLLLAQNEALSYSSNLAEVLARAEPDPDRLGFVRQLYRDLSRLQERVVGMLRAGYRWSPDA